MNLKCDRLEQRVDTGTHYPNNAYIFTRPSLRVASLSVLVKQRPNLLSQITKYYFRYGYKNLQQSLEDSLRNYT